MAVLTIVDSEEVVFEGQTVRLQPTLTKDGATYDVTGFTITCTVRRESDPYTSLGASYDNQATTLATPASGIVYNDFVIDPAVFEGPALPDRTEPYIAEWYVSDDDYYPQKMRFHVARSLRE